MMALSLHQPWASLIYDLRKTIETRHWPTNYRGLLAIHAAKTVDREACEDFDYDYKTIPRGAVLCVVNLEDCVRFPNVLARPDDYGDFTAGRYGFLFTVVKRFPQPIPAIGRQGMFHWKEATNGEQAEGPQKAVR
jgi:hypothetical protein